jgi:phosphatidylethanolamine/phosphatidyl-N-methylethanolamine N-methyltransferase
MSKRSFLKEFFKANRMVGSVLPSSRFLSKRMLQPIVFQNAKVIVELGPGTGVFTKELLKQMHPKCHLVVIELNDAFFNDLQLKLQAPNLHLIHGSATDISTILERLYLPKADVILSSLPLSNFPADLRRTILEEVKSNLQPDGKLIQFQYSRGLKKLYGAHFKQVSIDYTVLNFPPAFIYTCTNS